MKTDKVFHSLLQGYPALLFQLLGLPPETAEYYEAYKSIEIKEKAFRLDGVMLPKTATYPICFVEVQFKKEDSFYHRVFSEVLLYIKQFEVRQHWKVLVIFGRKSMEPERSLAHQLFFDQGVVEVIHLKDYLTTAEDSLGMNTLRLILADKQKTPLLAKKLLETVFFSTNKSLEKLIEAIVLYKFPTLTREEIQTMLELDFDITQTTLYAEAKTEGKIEGEHRGFAKGLISLLTDRFGALDANVTEKLQASTDEQLQQYYKRIWTLESVEDLFS
jgi:predicted transposase/invertase (TIGR01784 family)